MADGNGGLLGALARVGRPLLLLDASVLLVGVLLTAFNMLLIGWSVYAVGHVLAIVAFLAIAALHRDRMDGWTWVGLLTVEVGLILSLPQVASIWSSYVETPTAVDMLVPSQTAPIGRFAEAIVWIGVAFFGLAGRGASVLPSGVGWIFVVASVIGLAAAFFDVWFITPLWWVPAMLVMILGLVAVGAELVPDARVSPSLENTSLSGVRESRL
jgi:hypothetical protein